jgi:protocatechuate 3,4-dioxygenase beta subunit
MTEGEVRVRWCPLALLLCASFASAQSDAQKTARVEGNILSLNGDLVRKATVRLQGTPGQPGQPLVSYGETTDNGGKFVFDDVAPGRYTLSADKPGFVPARYGARSSSAIGKQLDLTAGMEMKDLAIKMTPQGVIAGKVLDADGDPVISAQIQAMRSAYSRGRKQLQPAGGTTTNDLGEFRIASLAPGRYYISASDRRQPIGNQDRPGRPGEVQEGSITTYYPNVAGASSAVPVDVAAGAEMRGIDIRLLRGKIFTVRGKAAVESAMPGSAVVTLSRKDDGSNLPAVLNGGGSTQLRPDGTFEFRDIIPGTYVLQLAQVNVAGGNPRPNLTGRVELTVGDADVEGVVLPIGPAPEISGTVRLEDGDLATLVKPAQGRLQLVLAATEGTTVGASTTQVPTDGTFRFANLAAAKYVLSVLALPSGTYLKSARFGGQDVLHAPIDTASGTGGTLELVLSFKGATVTGSVQNDKGEAMAGTMVTLWPKTPDPSPISGVHFGFTDPNGAFKFESLAPGDYYVAAWDETDPGILQSVEFLSHFISDAGAITLAEGGQESKDLKPVPADKVAIEIAKLP